MNIAHSSRVKKSSSGLCPHGLPYGACPICLGMGGGGKLRKADKSKNEMSWSQCYAIWQQMLKAKDIASKEKLKAEQAQISFSQKIGDIAAKIANLADKLTNVTEKIQNLPKIISKPILLAKKILVGVLNLTKNIFLTAQKALNFVQQKFADISDKLSAIYGEIKNFIEKNISNKFNKFKKKLKSLFGLAEPEEVEDVAEEEKKIEENKKLFKMKTVLQKIKEKVKREK